jgi:RNA recognition motif-containing protein
MTNIFVARLDFGVTQEDLKSLFEQYGRVAKVSLAMDRETGKSKGFAFIEMGSSEEAQAAISGLDGYSLNGREMAVKEAENRDSNKPKREFGAPSSERKPFNRDSNDSRPPRSEQKSDFRSEYKKLDDPKPFNVITPDIINPNKIERKKELPKKKEGKPKTHKMEAYKKSGKQNRFLDYDDDDDF